MNKHTKQTWDIVLQARLHPAALLYTGPADLAGYLATTKELKEAIKMRLLREMVNNKKETAIKMLVERYQLVSAVLINLFFEYQHDASVTPELKQFYQEFREEFVAIIMLLQNSCGYYFNYDLPLPHPLRFRKGWVLKRSWGAIVRKLKGATGNQAIVKILDRYVKEFLQTNIKTALTYHQANYLQQLMKEISANFSRPEYHSLTELLIGCNFDEFEFMQVIFNDLWREFNDKQSDELRLAWLKNKRKEVGMIPEKTSTGFRSKLYTVKQAILQWIEEEVVFLEEIGKVGISNFIREEQV